MASTMTLIDDSLNMNLLAEIVFLSGLNRLIDARGSRCQNVGKAFMSNEEERNGQICNETLYAAMLSLNVRSILGCACT